MLTLPIIYNQEKNKTIKMLNSKSKTFIKYQLCLENGLSKLKKKYNQTLKYYVYAYVSRCYNYFLFIKYLVNIKKFLCILCCIFNLDYYLSFSKPLLNTNFILFLYLVNIFILLDIEITV